MTADTNSHWVQRHCAWRQHARRRCLQGALSLRAAPYSQPANAPRHGHPCGSRAEHDV